MECNFGTTERIRTKIRGSRLRGSQSVLFFLLPVQRGLRDTYSAPISTVFETTDVNRCAGPYTREKFPNFCIGVLQAPKNCPGRGILGGVLVISVQLKQHNFVGCRQFPRMCLLYPIYSTISGDRNHFGAVDNSQGCAFWM